MGGLKTIAAIILIKIKIVLVVATIVAITVFTVKYLLGPAATNFAAGLYGGNKGNHHNPPPTGTLIDDLPEFPHSVSQFYDQAWEYGKQPHNNTYL